MSDFKKRVQLAAEKFAQKNLPKAPRPKNKSPEKEVERDVKAYLNSVGFHYSVIESKAVFSQGSGTYLNSQATIGCPDILGLTNQGQFVAIELKSPGRRNNLSLGQYQFLKKTIDRFGIGVVVDSSLLLKKYLEHYLSLSPDEGRKYLLSILPVKKEWIESSSGPLFG